jgi:predicted transporter
LPIDRQERTLEDMSDLQTAVNQALTRVVVIAGLGGIAVVHILQAPDGFAATFYIGLLFCLAVVACLVLAAAVATANDNRATELAGGLASLILLLYVISRCFGLPAFTDEKGIWDEPLGLLSMVFEGLVICVTAATMSAPRLAAAPMRQAHPQPS